MEWRDEGIVLATRRHGETSVIAEIFTRDHGRHMGLVRGGRSRRLQPVLQPGNSLFVVWRARLDEHLGTWGVEPLEARAAQLLEARHRLYAFQTLAGHLRLFPERDPHPDIHRQTAHFLQQISAGPEEVAALLARLELTLLADLGHGLDLSGCAGGGPSDDLAFVSPKSGRAVSAGAGEPYADRLLPLP
ncbi:MAG: DNA repair protein RecO, partial [Flavobacteriaceae bacterium]